MVAHIMTSTPGNAAFVLYGKRAAFMHKQSGAVLIMALIILMVMTLLAISIMSTTSLESKMATNSQESNRALHAAESALNYYYDDGAIFKEMPIEGSTINTKTAAYATGTASVDGIYANRSNKPRRSMNRRSTFSNTTHGTANFEFTSEGSTSGGATATVTMGVSQIVQKH